MGHHLFGVVKTQAFMVSALYKEFTVTHGSCKCQGRKGLTMNH